MPFQKTPERVPLHARQSVISPSPAPQVLRAALGMSAAAVLTFGFASAAMAQTQAPSSPPSDATAPVPSKGAADALGSFVQQSGKLMQQGVANMGAGFGQMVGAIGGQAKEATRDAADAARDAAESVSKLPSTGITAGHEPCAIAPNGAPDCGSAAAALCRAKGFASGTSVDFVTVENCPPEYRTSRRKAPQGVCTMDHFVTKALCQ